MSDTNDSITRKCTLEDVEEALGFLDPSMPREEWWRVVAAVQSEFPDDCIDVLDTWSSKGDNYEGGENLRATLDSLTPGGGIGINTLFAMAKVAGYAGTGGNPLTDSEIAAYEYRKAERVEAAKQARLQREADALQKQKETAKTAQEWWDEADEITDENRDVAYLAKKQISGKELRLRRGCLLSPMLDEDGKIWNVEQIWALGIPKRGLLHGRRTGLFNAINGNRQHTIIYIGEGYATAETVHNCTGHTVLVAYGKSNLKRTAEIIKEKQPKARIIILGDVGDTNDCVNAAAAVDGEVTYPTLVEKNSDFNDLFVAEGKDAVVRALAITKGYSIWDEIVPLDLALPEVEKFDYLMLPVDLVGWIRDEAERMQCPPDFIAVTVMTGLATLIGRKIAVFPMTNNDWKVVVNLWALLIGTPSSMKSPSMTCGLNPLERLAAAASVEYQDDMQAYAVDKALNKAQKKQNDVLIADALKSGDPSEIAKAKQAVLAAEKAMVPEPVEKRFIVNDITIEMLGILLGENPSGLLMKRDEIGGWLFNMRDPRMAGERAHYLEMWNGDGGMTWDRVGRGTLHVESNTLSLLGGIQPAKLKSYIDDALNKTKGDDGFAQRMQLAVYPDPQRSFDKHFNRAPDRSAKEKAFKVFQRLHDLLPEVDDDGGIAGVRFDDGGQKIFTDWRGDLEQMIRKGGLHPALQAHFTKYRSLMPSLALIINEIEVGHYKPITKQSAMKAVKWCKYLESHTHRIYAGAVDPMIHAAQLIVERRHKLPEMFTPRLIQQKKWSGLTDSGLVHAALDELMECNYIKQKMLKKATGRPSFAFIWNPGVDALHGREKIIS